MDARQNPASVALDALIERLHARPRLRVWSLVITIFGDSVVPRGGLIGLSTLQDVVGRLRIEPGALRTAMSRLVADGWVIRERKGRHSYFRLHERGLHAFDLATRRIYAPAPPAWDGTWTVAIASPGSTVAEPEQLRALGFVAVGGAYLRPETSDQPDAASALSGMLVIKGDGTGAAEAFRALWPADGLLEAYEGFCRDFRPLAQAIDRGAQLSPLDAIAARTLLIHDWRRIILREPALPAALLPKNWIGAEARALTSRLRAALAQASDRWLEEAGLHLPEQR